VGVRFVAFGSQFWQSWYNYLDVGMTFFCVITVLVVFFSGCSAKGEEVFDDVLLIARNAIQFGRLALVMRRSVVSLIMQCHAENNALDRSGKSVFSRVSMIDLDEANDENDNFFTLDLDQEDEEADLAGRRRFVCSFLILPANVEQGGRRSWGVILESS
jgi:hypothetical protein